MNQKKNSVSIILEGLWLVIAIAMFVMGIYASINHGFKNSYTFFIITAIAAFLFYVRRSLRLKERDS